MKENSFTESLKVAPDIKLEITQSIIKSMDKGMKDLTEDISKKVLEPMIKDMEEK